MRSTPIVLVLASAVMLATAGCGTIDGKSFRAKTYKPKVSEGISVKQKDSSVVKTTPVTAVSSNTVNTNTNVLIAKRSIKKEDKVTVTLLTGKGGVEQKFDMEVNDLGEITLPNIGSIKVEGLTTSEAQQMIEKKYIADQYYKKMNVIIVVEVGEFFVSGEVRMPGKYKLSTDTTLWMAITIAGGPTDFADLSKVTLRRGTDVKKYDAKKISEGKAEDPLIRRDDIIEVK